MIEMRKATPEEKIQYMARENGINFLLSKLAEECSEYAAAHLKIVSEGMTPDRMLHVEEELADVINIIMQIDFLIDDDSRKRLDMIIEKKIDEKAAEKGLRL